MAVDSDISGVGVRRLFRRRTGYYCTRSACARGSRIHHKTERFETNDLAMRKCRCRSSFLVFEQSDLVGGDRDGRWGVIGESYRRIRSRQDSALCAARRSRGICGGNRHCIFCSIEWSPGNVSSARMTFKMIVDGTDNAINCDDKVNSFPAAGFLAIGRMEAQIIVSSIRFTWKSDSRWQAVFQ